jgi:hypothetical protein
VTQNIYNLVVEKWHFHDLGDLSSYITGNAILNATEIMKTT